MKLNTPLITLLAGAALGVGVLVTSTVWTPGTASANGSATTPPTSATTVTVPLTTSAAAPAPTPASTPATTPASTPASAPTSAPALAPTSAPAAASASTSYAPPEANYVGQVNGGGAAVAISVHKGKAVAYVCNGHAVAAWYRGTAANGTLNLTGKNGATLSVTYHSGTATGSVMADGVHYTFSAGAVRGTAPAGQRPPGLYEATATVDGVTIKAVWIVQPNGSQIGSVEYELGSAVLPTAQAPVLNLATGTARYDGITLVASLISGLTGSGF